MKQKDPVKVFRSFYFGICVKFYRTAGNGGRIVCVLVGCARRHLVLTALLLFYIPTLKSQMTFLENRNLNNCFLIQIANTFRCPKLYTHTKASVPFSLHT